MSKKWSEPKGEKHTTVIRHSGFKTSQEMVNYAREHKINAYSMGYNKKDKHYFEYKMGE